MCVDAEFVIMSHVVNSSFRNVLDVMKCIDAPNEVIKFRVQRKYSICTCGCGEASVAPAIRAHFTVVYNIICFQFNCCILSSSLCV